MSASIVSFESFAPAILNALGDADQATARYASVLSQNINAYIDTCRAAGYEKNEIDCGWVKYELVNCPAMIDAVAYGLIADKTVNEYGNGAMRAFFHGVPWSASLKNDPAFKLPWVKAKPGRAPKAKPAANVSSASQQVTPAPAAPTSQDEVRAHVQKVANELGRYIMAHFKHADLQTRDVVQHFTAAVAKLSQRPGVPLLSDDEDAPM